MRSTRGLETFGPGEGPAPTPVAGPGDCPATAWRGAVLTLYCTRDVGHPGPFHEAEGTRGELVGRWPVKEGSEG